jgi:ribosomal protein L17
MPGVQVGALEALLAQEIVLAQQVDALSGRARELSRQIQRLQGEARTPVRAQLSETNLQLADTRAALTSVRQQIRGKLAGRPGGYSGQSGFPQQPRQDYIPGEAVAASIIIFILAVLMPLSIGFTRRLWKRGSPAPRAAEDTVSPRLERLEHAVDAIAIEIERVSEGQRFMTKVMSERPAAPVKQPEAEDPSVLSEMKPFLALGAGPAEPIPVAQRQAVRQSVTPH